jgi:hypothetical protein
MTSTSPGQDFKERLTQRFYVRIHMTLMLSTVVLSGIVSSKVLLELGVRSMLLRYLIVLAVAYGLFFVLIRIWLWYISETHRNAPPKDCGRLADLIPDISSVGEFSPRSTGPGSSGGENFTGGGAGGPWEAEGGTPSIVSGGGGSGCSTAQSSGGLGSIFDADDAIVLVVLALLVAVIFGAGLYIVYQAPALLSEVAFEALLASGLVKASQRIQTLGWVGSVFRATLLPLSLVLVMTVTFGLVAAHYCPNATKIAEVVTKCE